MLGSELVTLLEGFVDDTVNESLAIALFNSIKENIETERTWNYLMKSVDYTVTANTAFQDDLPTDFSAVVKVVDENGAELLLTSKDMQAYGGSDKYYIWDDDIFLNFNYGKDTTITLYYKKASDIITTDTDVDFPSRWINILAYYGSAQYFALDAGEKSMSWDDRWYKIADDLKKAMIRWDNNLSIKIYNESQITDTGYYDNKQSI